MKTLILLVLILASCGTKNIEEVKLREGIKVIKLEGTDICLIVYNRLKGNTSAADGVAMLRVDCNEVPNPLVIPVNQALEKN
jgi:hypothetical protein